MSVQQYITHRHCKRHNTGLDLYIFSEILSEGLFFDLMCCTFHEGKAICCINKSRCMSREHCCSTELCFTAGKRSFRRLKASLFPLFPLDSWMSYQDRLVVIDAVSGRTAQLVIWKWWEKAHTASEVVFGRVWKTCRQEGFSFTWWGIIFQVFDPGRKFISWKYSNLWGLLYKQGCLPQWFWEQTIPSKCWW